MQNEEEIFRRMEREYRKLDAENHLEEYEKYLKDEEVNKLEGKNRDRFLNDLVDLFEKYKDCNIAENDTWSDVIKLLLNKLPDYEREEERKYTITITETLAKDVVLTARSKEEALRIVEEKYYSCEPDYILGADCFVEVDFQTVREEE